MNIIQAPLSAVKEKPGRKGEKMSRRPKGCMKRQTGLSAVRGVPGGGGICYIGGLEEWGVLDRVFSMNLRSRFEIWFGVGDWGFDG